MNLFIFFALPIATILLAIVFQKILESPILVAIAFFAIYLIVSFVAFLDNLAEALIVTIIYTIIAYLTAYIVMIICRLKRRFNCYCNREHNCNMERVSDEIQNCTRGLCGNSAKELNEKDSLPEISGNAVNMVENRATNRPVALGNNIFDRSNTQRRYYNRRW